MSELGKFDLYILDDYASITSQEATVTAALNAANVSSPELDDDVPSTRRAATVTTRLTAEEVKSMWNLTKLLQRLGTTKQCVEFALEHELILSTRLCTYHKAPMQVFKRGNCSLGTFLCRRGVCRPKSGISRAKGTWFENSKLPLPLIFYLMYCYAHKWSVEAVRLENFVHGPVLSTGTISDWYNYCRETVVVYQIEQQESLGQIGGPGKVVQIDERKFGKRKFNKGSGIEGHLVLGMIEDGSDDLRLEVCPDNVRPSESLIPLIRKHVAPGTVIHTNCWKAYDGLDLYGYIHKRVNHSDSENPFVADDGTHTQRIQSQWRVVKRFFAKDNYSCVDFADTIVEYLWRRNIMRNHHDPFVKLMEAIKYSYKVPRTTKCIS